MTENYFHLLYPCSPKGEGVYLFYLCPSKIFFVAFFSVTVGGINLIFGHKLHIGTPYCGKRFWIHQIPTSCLPTLLIFIHIEHICSFFVAFFSTTIDGRDLIFGHKLHIGHWSRAIGPPLISNTAIIVYTLGYLIKSCLVVVYKNCNG